MRKGMVLMHHTIFVSVVLMHLPFNSIALVAHTYWPA